MGENVKDSQSRKWQLTINNPVEKGFTHEKLNSILASMASVIYYCMADEIGENQTYHTHVFLCGRSGIRFSTLKKQFEGAHFEMAKGTAEQNMQYVSKTGKWLNDRKRETCVDGTFEEYGEMPIERQGKRNDLDDLYGMIKDGLTNYEIMEQMPEALLNLDKIEMTRQTIIQEKYKNQWRDVQVEYIYGDTGSGKTRSIMEQYGYSNVFRVTDYLHPFDGYKNQDVVIFEEFRSSIRFTEMLTLIEGYPVELPCRYANKYACYTKVYIITNVPLSKQYPAVQLDESVSWLAFLRRIHKVKKYTYEGIQESHIEITKDVFRTVLDGEFIPFREVVNGSKNVVERLAL